MRGYQIAENRFR